MTSSIDWTTALGVLAVGLVVGAFFVFRFRRSQAAALAPQAPLEMRDALGRRDALVQQLRELADTESKLPAEERATARAALELELARVLMAIDGAQAKQAKGGGKSAQAAAAVPTPARGGAAKGFLWGAASMAALAILFFWVQGVARPRTEGGQLTGNLPERGGAPASTDEQQLRAAVEQNPDDLEARVALAQTLLGQGDMMGVWNETQYVLQRKPGEPRALSYQALVRLAMGQPDLALKMLQESQRTAPDLIDTYTHLAFVHLAMGKPAEAKQTIVEAQRRFPQDAQRLEEAFETIRARLAERAKKPPAGEENPHAGIDAAAEAAAPPHPAPAPAAAPPAASAPAPAAAPGRRVQGTLELDPALVGQVQPGVVFVMARPAGVAAGPPLAVRRLVVGAYPAAFELGDGDSMAGEPLPDKMRLDVRADQDGDAATKDAADPKGSLDAVAVGSSGVKIVLKR